MRLSGSARALALEIAAEARAEWGYASDLIARTFRAHRELGSSDRRRISETVYGLIRADRLLEKLVAGLCVPAIRRGDTVSPITRDELKLIVYELREGIPIEAVRNDVKRLLRVDVALESVVGPDAGLDGTSGIEREALRLSVPDWLARELFEQLGPAEAASVIEAMNHRAPLAVRVNTALTTREQLITSLAEEGVTAVPGRWSTTSLILETRVNAFALSAFRAGLFEVMDEGSQLVAELLAPPPGGRVVDACAGAGGKTLAIAAAMGGKGRVLALDVDGKKLEELRRRARRASLNNVAARAIARESDALPDEARPAGWDRVLVDAPCSGLGTLRRNPEARWRLTPSIVAEFPPRQVALMITYAPLVAVGGRLIYATCTVMAQENERVIERFLAERSDFVRMSVKEIWGKARAEELGLVTGPEGDGYLRMLPNRHDTDGFFAAVLRRVK